MKLIGEVEVFKIYEDGTSKSVIRENNMVVDGASEVIVDMLTTPYSLKNVDNSAALDCSNFMVQAVSFGKAQKLYGGSVAMSAAQTSDIGMHSVFNNRAFSSVYVAKDPTSDVLSSAWIGGVSLDGSSFRSSTDLPKSPNPRDLRLEDSSKTQIEFYYENSAAALSSYADQGIVTFNPTSATLLGDYGHNLNSLYASSVKSIATLHQGCYAPSDGMDLYIFDGSRTKPDIEAIDPEAVGAAAPYNVYLLTSTAKLESVSGHYNRVGCLDQNGFLRAYPLQYHPASATGDTSIGVSISAADTNSLGTLSYTGGGLLAGSTAFLERPTVCYNFTISAPDLKALAAYKGVTNIGLWALDLKETLKLEAAPISWTTPTNNRKYKLFAKKIFSEDLTYIQDINAGGLLASDAGIGNYSNLNIQWRMNFAFGDSY